MIPGHKLNGRGPGEHRNAVFIFDLVPAFYSPEVIALRRIKAEKDGFQVHKNVLSAGSTLYALDLSAL